jgi:exodeoxyribonuclease VIII
MNALITDMSMLNYHAHPAISKSRLDLIHRSPAHYKAEAENPSEPTAAMLWGSMYHSLILTPDDFARTYAVMPEGIDRRTKEGKDAWAAWQEEYEGMTPVDRPTMTELTAMRDALMAHSFASAALQGGLTEQSYFAMIDGVECKCRPDFVLGNTMTDLKTCKDARPDMFSRATWDYRYHVQGSFYPDVYFEATRNRIELFLLVAQEKTRPYAVNVFVADEAMLDQGRREYLDDLAIYRECLDLDVWPAYPEKVQALVLPVWAQEEI